MNRLCCIHTWRRELFLDSGILEPEGCKARNRPCPSSHRQTSGGRRTTRLCWTSSRNWGCPAKRYSFVQRDVCQEEEEEREMRRGCCAGRTRAGRTYLGPAHFVNLTTVIPNRRYQEWSPNIVLSLFLAMFKIHCFRCL